MSSATPNPLPGVKDRHEVTPVMTSYRLTRWGAFTLLLLNLLPPNAPAESFTGRTLSRAVLLDKIRGGWAGQMIGVAYGAPTEFKSNGRILEGELRWEAGMLENTLQQDDLYVEMTFARVMDDVGLDATPQDYGRAFRDSKYHLWHANAAARRLLNQGLEPPWTGHPRYNIHANDIDFQIEADFIGLMCPGLPRAARTYAERVGQVMNHGDGLYGGLFVAAMYSAAFFESDPRRVVEAGLAALPSRSGYARIVRDVLDLSAQHPNDWRHAWSVLQEKWDRDDVCPDGALRPFNIDARLNGAYIVFGLLFGEGDFLRTMEISTRCGQDSDCNPSSAAGVLGVMLGYDGIPAEFTAPMASLADRRFDYTEYSFADIVRSTEKRALEVIRRAGGRVTDVEVTVPRQRPRPPRLEQWSPGVPDRRIAVTETPWSWNGEWTTHEGHRIATQSGAEATLEFEGVAVAILARLDQESGRVEVFLDGDRKGEADAYIVERTHDNALWHIYGLKPGRHTLRLVVLPDRDPRSRGSRVALSEAVIYRAH